MSPCCDYRIISSGSADSVCILIVLTLQSLWHLTVISLSPVWLYFSACSLISCFPFMTHTDHIYFHAGNIIFTHQLQAPNSINTSVWAICNLQASSFKSCLCLGKARLVCHHFELMSQGMTDYFLSNFQIRHIVMCVFRERLK